MKHRRDSQEYNANNFKHTDLDQNGYVDWEEYITPVGIYFILQLEYTFFLRKLFSTILCVFKAGNVYLEEHYGWFLSKGNSKM